MCVTGICVGGPQRLAQSLRVRQPEDSAIVHGMSPVNSPPCRQHIATSINLKIFKICHSYHVMSCRLRSPRVQRSRKLLQIMLRLWPRSIFIGVSQTDSGHNKRAGTIPPGRPKSPLNQSMSPAFEEILHKKMDYLCHGLTVRKT